ncbi:elongin-A-like [Haliotis rubra]|uniref:elongin-A-like n=1 Tax=Haliotis rubra TaxID=36100 RepID=UPI001EE4FCDA|nr:elongin-A-like [Haliotis rubra]
MAAPVERKMNYDKFKVKKKTEVKPAREESPVLQPEAGTSGFGVPPAPKNVKITEQDILGYLPETHAHYRPWRFNEVDKKQVHDPTKIGFKSNTRTQVYSGRKHTTTTMKPLFDICMQVLIDNIDSIDYVGGIPADILMPVLKRCTATQLYNLEDCNPHFLEDTDELWHRHCERDFRKQEPEEMETWREMYLRLLDEREAKYERLKGRMSKTVKNLDTTAKKVKLAYVDSVVAKPPREVKRMQQKYGTATISKAPNKGNVDMCWSRSKTPAATRPIPPPKPMRRVAPMMQKTMKMIKKLTR